MLTPQRVYINNHWYTIKCTVNQSKALQRAFNRAVWSKKDCDIQDYYSLVKLLIHVHKRRKARVEALQLKLPGIE